VLTLDAHLRARGTSLDAAVARLRRAATDDEDRPAREVLAALGPGLVEVVEPLLDQPFPDLSTELAALGIDARGQLSPSPLREAITGRRE